MTTVQSTEPNSRRHFLQVATGIAATAAASNLWGQPNDVIPIIDCHQHLWDLKRQKLPWLKGNELLERNYVMADYLTAIRGTGIAKAVYMEVDVAHEEKVAEGELVTEICRRGDSPTIAAVIGCVPDAPRFSEYLRHWHGYSFVKGFRTVLFGEDERCLQPEFVKAVQLLGETGYSFDLCMTPTRLENGAKLAEQCPGTRFIVDHCGNAPITAWRKENRNDAASQKSVTQWQRSMTRLAKKETTLCKISGIIAQVEKTWSAEDLAPIINFCLDTFGPDRVIVGSDWPVCLKGATLADWMKTLRQIVHERPVAEQRKLFHENAVRFYGLAKL